MSTEATSLESAGVQVDPVTFEIIRHKLYRVVDEAVIALENVSGSPITNEGHDMMVSLYGADGGLMVGGVGFLHHLTSAAQAVKHIIKEFSDDPGVFEDDVYFLNDSYTAALHPPDVYLIAPIHHEGRLTGFVANFVHVTDIGAVDPGGFSPNARDNYHEGFQTKGLKLVERGKMRRDVLETFLNMVRDPGMTNLDLKSQMAANFVAKERMHKLYEDYGLETVQSVSTQLIAQSEQLVRQRLAELPDGTWQARQYLDLPDGGVIKILLTATKEGDSLTYDFTGTDPQSHLGVNCCYWATWGGMFAPIFPLLAWDVVWNEGVTRPITLIAPQGTCVNCIRPAPISIATVGVIQMVNNLSVQILSKIMGASDEYKDRATAVWAGSHAHIETHGLNAQGEFFVAPLTDTFAGAGGARAFKDGVDIGGEIPNVVSRWANVETQELNTPLLYLYRRAVPDSGGAGKYRGGVCHEYAFRSHDIGPGGFGAVIFGKGVRSPMSHGIFGGYPGCRVAYHLWRHANIAEGPHSFESTSGESRVDCQWGDLHLNEDDAFYIRFMGGGGYGDPLEREAAAVVQDVLAGTVTRPAAVAYYGVVLDSAGQILDPDMTAARRAAIRAERLGGHEPEREPTPVERTPERLGEYLQLRQGQVQCTRCGALLAPATARWKDVVPSRKRVVEDVGSHLDGNTEFFLREYCCPSCATLLEIDVVYRDDGPLYDEIRRWPTPTASGFVA